MSKCFENCKAPNRCETLLFSRCTGFFSYVLGLCVCYCKDSWPLSLLWSPTRAGGSVFEDLSQASQPEAWLQPVDPSRTVDTSAAGNGNPLQYACLGNPMNRGSCWATVHVIAKSRTQLSD